MQYLDVNVWQDIAWDDPQCYCKHNGWFLQINKIGVNLTENAEIMGEGI